jgi:hypothetical protein
MASEREPFVVEGQATPPAAVGRGLTFVVRI